MMRSMIIIVTVSAEHNMTFHVMRDLSLRVFTRELLGMHIRTHKVASGRYFGILSSFHCVERSITRYLIWRHSGYTICVVCVLECIDLDLTIGIATM